MQILRARSIVTLIALAAALLVSLPACSGGQPQGGSATYGPSSQNAYARPAPPPAQQPYAQPAYGQPQDPAHLAYGQPAYPQPTYPQSRPLPAPQPSYAGGAFPWYSSFQQAAAHARREGKVILVGSTQPGCSLCVKFKDQIVPSAGSSVSSVAVGYLAQPKSNPNDPVWQLLRRNLPRERMMPLVGVVSPDMQWLSGFGGPPDRQKLMSALATARGRYRAAAPALVPVPRQAVPQVAGIRTTAQLNEYGEVEWSPTGVLFPAPDEKKAGIEEAADNDPALARGPVEAPETAPEVEAEAALVALVAPDTATEDWAIQALETVHDQIRAGELDQAKRTLAAIQSRLPRGPLSREAAKGQVAIYSATKLQRATTTDTTEIRDRARKSLRGSMWMDLFF